VVHSSTGNTGSTGTGTLLTQEAVRAAHRQLALWLHPDKQAGSDGAGDPGAEVALVSAQEAAHAWNALQAAKDALLEAAAGSNP
jgi:hypothetical protein